MERLAAGVRIFKNTIVPKRRHFFERLEKGQAPHTLFITCADSRVVPSLITHTGPGELFVERNPGNIVPVYSDQWVGVSASIEYAVAALGVAHVIVCGHSDCGAVKGILHPEKVAGLPAVDRWLRYGEKARERALAELGEAAGEEAQIELLTRLHVVRQMEHLHTHPSVERRFQEGRLTIDGWVYDISSGEVEAYDAAAGKFRAWPD